MTATRSEGKDEPVSETHLGVRLHRELRVVQRVAELVPGLTCGVPGHRVATASSHGERTFVRNGQTLHMRNPTSDEDEAGSGAIPERR